MKNKNTITKILRGKKILSIISFFSLCFLFFSLPNMLFPNASITEASTKQPVELTSIAVTENAVQIKANGQLTYRIYKASDPFTFHLDIEGANLGKFTQKIIARGSAITEIRPSQVNNPLPMAKLEILLGQPADLIPQMKDGTLILTVKAEENPTKEIAPIPTLKNAKTITAVKFEKSADSIEIVIKGDGNMPDPQVTETANSITIFIPDITMKASLPQKIPSPVKDIKYNPEKNGIKFQVYFERNIDALAFAFSDEIIIDIPNTTESLKKTEIVKKETIKEKPAASPPTTKPETTPPPLQPDNAKLISLDFQDADVTAILRLLADVSGKNIIIHPDVKGKTSMKLVNVQWEEALEVILKTFLLEKVMYGNIIRVIPMKALQDEMKAIADLKDATKRTEEQHTRVFTANYASVEQFKDAIEKSKFLTKDLGSITIDPRTRSITVKDTERVLDEIAKMLESIDKPTKQVLIEARIVELFSDTARSLGIEWGLKARPFNWESAIIGGLPDAILGGMVSPGLINLPATTVGISDPTSAITVGYLNRKQTFGLDMRLSAIEKLGKARIISRPKVITGDNQKAKIVQGESIPYGEREASGGTVTITTKFKDVAITIEVVPQVTNDNNILMNVLINKEDLRTFVDIGGGTMAPWTSKLESKTNLMVENGETMVIGGIYKKDERDEEHRVPGFASIPLVGELFKRRTKEDDLKEYIIFLTPKVVQR